MILGKSCANSRGCRRFACCRLSICKCVDGLNSNGCRALPGSDIDKRSPLGSASRAGYPFFGGSAGTTGNAIPLGYILTCQTVIERARRARSPTSSRPRQVALWERAWLGLEPQTRQQCASAQHHQCLALRARATQLIQTRGRTKAEQGVYAVKALFQRHFMRSPPGLTQRNAV